MKKFCICLMMLCIIGVISGCHHAHHTFSSEQQDNVYIDEENALSTKPQNSDILIPVSTSGSRKELELSDIIDQKDFVSVRILRDNRYGNEFVIVKDGEGLGICRRL